MELNQKVMEKVKELSQTIIEEASPKMNGKEGMVALKHMEKIVGYASSIVAMEAAVHVLMCLGYNPTNEKAPGRIKEIAALFLAEGMSKLDDLSCMVVAASSSEELKEKAKEMMNRAGFVGNTAEYTYVSERDNPKKKSDKTMVQKEVDNWE